MIFRRSPSRKELQVGLQYAAYFLSVTPGDLIHQAVFYDVPQDGAKDYEPLERTWAFERGRQAGILEGMNRLVYDANNPTASGEAK